MPDGCVGWPHGGKRDEGPSYGGEHGEGAEEGEYGDVRDGEQDGKLALVWALCGWLYEWERGGKMPSRWEEGLRMCTHTMEESRQES